MGDSGTTIRPARDEDVEAVRAVLVETWHDTYDLMLGADKVTEITNNWHSVANLRRQLTLPDTSFLVAEIQSRIIGHLFADARRAPMLVIFRLYVLPVFQRRGVGRRLIAAAAARHAGCTMIRLEVESANAKGLAFYRREGFQAVGNSVQDGVSHTRMERRLDQAQDDRPR